MDELNTDSAAVKQQLMDEGNRAFDTGDFARALDCYHRACLLDTQDAGVWTALGMTFNNLEFPREAWRSYLLALSLAPDDLDTLWYAAEFLAQLEDLELAHSLVGMYLEREQDPQRRADAETLAAELEDAAQTQGQTLGGRRETAAQQLLGQSDTPQTTVDYLERSEPTSDSEQDSPESEQAQPSAPEPVTAEADEEVSVQLSDEELERQAMAALNFIAPLQLRLSGFEALCRHCGLMIPADAPYCWSCKMIYFYE